MATVNKKACILVKGAGADSKQDKESKAMIKLFEAKTFALDVISNEDDHAAAEFLHKLADNRGYPLAFFRPLTEEEAEKAAGTFVPKPGQPAQVVPKPNDDWEFIGTFQDVQELFKDKDSFNDTFGCLMLNTSTKKGKAAEKHAHAKEGHAHAVHA